MYQHRFVRDAYPSYMSMLYACRRNGTFVNHGELKFLTDVNNDQTKRAQLCERRVLSGRQSRTTLAHSSPSTSNSDGDD